MATVSLLYTKTLTHIKNIDTQTDSVMERKPFSKSYESHCMRSPVHVVLNNPQSFSVSLPLFFIYTVTQRSYYSTTKKFFTYAFQASADVTVLFINVLFDMLDISTVESDSDVSLSWLGSL